MATETSTNETSTKETSTNSRLTPEQMTVTIPSAVSDNLCDVLVIQGEGMNSQRICFELALLSLNPEKAVRATLALPTPTTGYCLGIQLLKEKSAEESHNVEAPYSLALTAGLIAHGYVPDEWLCGLMTANTGSETTYVTHFDSQGIYGRSSLAIANLSDKIKAEFPRLDILQKQLKRTEPISVDSGRPLEALYVDHEKLQLDESNRERTLEKISEALEILVEPLPAPSSDLISAGLRWLAAEVK